MKQKLVNKIFFYILEFISAVVIVNIYILNLSFHVVTSNNEIEMFILGVLSFLFFTLIGILIPGFFYSRLLNKNTSLLSGIKYASLGIIIGILIIFIYDSLDPKLMISFVDQSESHIIWKPIIIGIIGFNIGLTKADNLNI